MILIVDNLSIRLPFGSELKTVVRHVSFQVAPGEIVGVVGESGCGKSLTNLAIMGLLPAGAVVEADRLELCGHDLRVMARRDWRAIRGAKAAMIFQNPMSALNPSLTVATQLIESIRRTNPRRERGDCERLAIDLLDEVGIASPRMRLRSYPHELSGGMAQRVMIAMAIAGNPALLIADEPTTALDVTTQAQILDILVRICRDHDMAMLLVSHDIGVVEKYAHRIQVMYSGEIVESGPVRRVSGQPAHPYTKGLLNSLPGRQRTLPKTPLATIPGMVPSIDVTIDGCRFGMRCGKAQPLCHRRPAPVRLIEDAGQWSRCHF